jgi:hypothetical protein
LVIIADFKQIRAGDDEQDEQQQHKQVDVVALMPPLRGAS